jgi:opacity protein-like surface antigen
MKPVLTPSILLLALVAVVLSPTGARAEWYLDAYAGFSSTQKTDVNISGLSVSGTPVQASLLDVKTEDSPILGLRFGYWFSFLPEVGLGADIFYFQPDVPSQTVTATGAVSGKILDEEITIGAAGPARLPSITIPAVVFAADVMLRWRFLQTPDIPNGRLQPYITVGPAWMVTDPEDYGTTLGFKVGGGFTWQFHRHMAVFLEYRYTQFLVDDVKIGGLKYGADVKSNHALGGFSFRF